MSKKPAKDDTLEITESKNKCVNLHFYCWSLEYSKCSEMHESYVSYCLGNSYQMGVCKHLCTLILHLTIIYDFVNAVNLYQVSTFFYIHKIATSNPDIHSKYM